MVLKLHYLMFIITKPNKLQIHSVELVLQGGLIVDENFTFTYSSNTGTEITDQNASGPVSNFVYETKKNNEKRIINVLKKEYLGTFISDFREIMTYDQSSQFITDKLKDTYNPRITGV